MVLSRQLEPDVLRHSGSAFAALAVEQARQFGDFLHNLAATARIGFARCLPERFK